MNRRTTARAEQAPGNQAADRVRTGDPELGKLVPERLDPNRLLRTSEVAKICGVSEASIREYRRQGRIRTVSPVGHPRYMVAEVLRFLGDPTAKPGQLVGTGVAVPMPPTVREMLERAIAHEQGAA